MNAMLMKSDMCSSGPRRLVLVESGRVTRPQRASSGIFLNSSLIGSEIVK